MERGYTLPVMLSLKECEAETGISYFTLRRYCISGKVKYIRAGKKWLINMNSLADFMNQGETFNHGKY